MTAAVWRDLALLTVTDPAAAARQLLAAAIPAEAMWSGLFLAVVWNAALYVLSGMMLPAEVKQEAMLTLPVWSYGVLVLAALAGLGAAVFKIGRGLGGTGSFLDVMVVLTWLQILRVAALTVTVALSMILPGAALLLTLAIGLYGLYILLNFVDQAHRLGSLGRAAGILVASGLAVAFGLAVLIMIGGAMIFGNVTHV